MFEAKISLRTQFPEIARFNKGINSDHARYKHFSAEVRLELRAKGYVFDLAAAGRIDITLSEPIEKTLKPSRFRFFGMATGNFESKLVEDVSMTDNRQPPDGNELSSQTRSGAVSTPVWLMVSLFAATAISFASAHAPPRIRLIGLFPIALGLLIGWFVAWSTSQFNAHPSRRFTVFIAMLLAFSGWIGVTGETFRQEELLSNQLPSNPIAARVIKEFEQQVIGTELEVPRPTMLASFRSYLARRIQQLGDWPSPWPEFFLLGESIAAAVAAGVISFRGSNED